MNIEAIRRITSPVAQLIHNLPSTRLTRANRHTQPITPAQQLQEMIKQNPSKRTYYLGKCGRVSQRKQLVGEIVATVRAFTADHARYLFTEAHLHDAFQPVCAAKPFIGHEAPKWHCPDCGRTFLSPVRSIAYPGQTICPGAGCYSRDIKEVRQ